MLSATLYRAFASSAFLSSSLHRIQGCVSSIYLFVRRTRFQISTRASLKNIFSIAFSTFSVVDRATAFRSSSKAVAVRSAGSVPPKYLSIIPTVLETRLPRSFARSELIR